MWHFQTFRKFRLTHLLTDSFISCRFATFKRFTEIGPFRSLLLQRLLFDFLKMLKKTVELWTSLPDNSSCSPRIWSFPSFLSSSTFSARLFSYSKIRFIFCLFASYPLTVKVTKCVSDARNPAHLWEFLETFRKANFSLWEKNNGKLSLSLRSPLWFWKCTWFAFRKCSSQNGAT